MPPPSSLFPAMALSSVLIPPLALGLALALAWAVPRLLRRGPIKRMRRRWRTARAERHWRRAAIPVPRPVDCRVVVTMTTSPDRLQDGLERVVRTLLNQTCAPDEIHLNIPETFLRTGERYRIPEWCGLVDPRVRVFRVADSGPVTKTLPTVERFAESEDVVLVIADDDVLYLQESIEELLRHIARDRSMAVGFSGYDFGPSWESVLARTSRPVEVIEGWAGYAVHRRCFGSGFAEYVRNANRCRACFLHDDVVVSNWFETQSVGRAQVQSSAVNRRRMRRLGAQLDFGYLPGALHQESSGASRAREAARHLESMGLWRLRSPSTSAALLDG